jgi:hypothetical protein
VGEVLTRIRTPETRKPKNRLPPIWASVNISGVVAEAREPSKPRAITVAIAKAVGIDPGAKVDYLNRENSDAIPGRKVATS